MRRALMLQLQRAKELQPDLILLDTTMPGMHGTEAASILKQLLPEVKIILFTLHSDGVNQSLASTFDIDVVISKNGCHYNIKRTPDCAANAC